MFADEMPFLWVKSTHGDDVFVDINSITGIFRHVSGPLVVSTAQGDKYWLDEVSALQVMEWARERSIDFTRTEVALKKD